MSAMTVQAVVRDGEIHVLDPFYTTRRQKAAKAWGDGTALTIRIEPEAEAWRYSDLKHYHGHFVRPVADYTGYTHHEVHELLFKAQFMPDGKTSITQLNREELRAFTEQCDAYVREQIPEAVSDPRYSGRDA